MNDFQKLNFCTISITNLKHAVAVFMEIMQVFRTDCPMLNFKQEGQEPGVIMLHRVTICVPLQQSCNSPEFITIISNNKMPVATGNITGMKQPVTTFINLS